MVDSLRKGGFGSPSLTGPFGTNTGGFGQYAIGGTAEDTAYLDKLEAQIAWQNGELSDGAYVSALRTYAASTEKGTTTNLRAVDELNDTIHSIERNKAVVRVNTATTPSARISALHALLRLDRSHLRGMRHDNEQYREQLLQIEGLQQDIRTARWSEVVDRYNRDQMSREELERQALSLAAQARGSSDEQQYREHARSIRDDILQGELNDLIEDWNDEPTAAKARAVRGQYRKMRSRAAPSSPEGERLEEGLAVFEDAVKSQAEEDAHERARLQHQHGTISDDGWLDHLRTRVKDSEVGSRERIRRRDEFLTESYALAEKRLNAAFEAGTVPATDLIDLYESSLAVMDLDSARALEVQAKVTALRAGAFSGVLDIRQPAEFGTGYEAQPFGGHMVYVEPQASAQDSATGFISQHDGSEFASTNCGMAASAMLAWAVSDGRVRVTGGEMRAYSGDAFEGTWVDDMVRAFDQLGIGAKQYTGMAYNRFHKKIAKGQPAVLTGWVGNIPKQYRQGTYLEGHSVYVDRVRQRKDGQVEYFVMDPSGRAGYEGQWWPAEVLQAFGWQNGGAGVAGSAVFAGKRGNVTKVNIKPPPFQAFDTDYRGRSTLGKGGGNSREEAGPRRDWSKGKTVKRHGPRTGTDDEMVTDFLKAIGKVERRAADQGYTMERDPLDEASRRRAAELLERHDGDPRLAAIEWFTGEAPGKVVKEWSQTERWYANAVGRSLGHRKLTRKDVIGPADYDPLAGPEPLTYDPLSSATSRMEPSGLDADLEGMADGILTRLGIAPSNDRRRIVAAWLTAQTGDGKVEGNNPLALMTNGTGDLEGQYGKTEDGRAIFDTLESGLDAAAASILEDAPQLVGAIREGDGEGFVRTLADAGWSAEGGYAAAVTEAFNTLPGTTRIIANTRTKAFTVPATLGAAAEKVPEINELMDVDPFDPVQRSWFDDNRDRAFEAVLKGADTWRLQTPDGRNVWVDASSALTHDIIDLDVSYTTMTAPPTPEGQDAIDKAQQQRMAMGAELAFEEAAGYMETAMQRRDQAVLRQDWTLAYNIEQNARMMLNAVTGQGPLETPDVQRLRDSEWLGDSQITQFTGWVEALEPRVTDASSEFYNPGGGSVLGGWALTDKLAVTHALAQMPEGVAGTAAPTGIAIEATPMVDEMFVSMDPVTGVPIIHTRESDPAAFEPVTEIDYFTGETVTIPRYQSREVGGYVPVTNGGMTFTAPIEQMSTPFITVAQQRFEGPDKGIIERTNQGGNGTMLDSPFDASRIQMGPDNIISYASGASQPAATDQPGPARSAEPVNSSMVPLGELDMPVWSFSYKDFASGQTVTWVSLDQQEWLGYFGNRFGTNKAPMVVITPGSGLKAIPGEAPGDPVALEFHGEAYQGQRPIGEVMHFYGTRESDFPLGQDGQTDLGAPGGDFMFRRLQLGDGPGMVMFDATPTPQERYRAGQISARQLTAQMMAVRPPTQDQLEAMGGTTNAFGLPVAGYTGSTPAAQETPATATNVPGSLIVAGIGPKFTPGQAWVDPTGTFQGTIDRHTAARAKATEAALAAERAAIYEQQSRFEMNEPSPAPSAMPSPAPRSTATTKPEVSKPKTTRTTVTPTPSPRYDPLSSAPTPKPKATPKPVTPQPYKPTPL